MSTTPRAGIVVDVAALQHAPSQAAAPAARYAEAMTLALLEVPGLVHGLVLHPRLPIPGGLHPVVVADQRLTWNTAAQLRRLRAGGAVALVIPGAGGVPSRVQAVPRHVRDSGLVLIAGLDHPGAMPVAGLREDVTLVATAGDGTRLGTSGRAVVTGGCPQAAVAVAVEVAGDGGISASVPTRVALVEGLAGPTSAALAGCCVVSRVDPAVAAASEFEPWAYDATIVHVTSAQEGRQLTGLMRRHPCVLWIAGVDIEPELVRRARAVIVPSQQARIRTILRGGAGFTHPPFVVADPQDPDSAAAAIVGVVHTLAGVAA